MKKISKKYIQRIIQEERIRMILEQEDLAPAEDTPAGHEHHWPRVEWSNVGQLVDSWAEMEGKAFDNGDPSMSPEDMPAGEAKAYWLDQIEAASMDLENELTQEIRKVALAKMKEITTKLINGEYA